MARLTHALPTVDLLGVRIHAISEERCVAHVLDQLHVGNGGWVATPNLDHLRRLCKDSVFRATCSEASLLVPDGMPLLFAAWLQRTPMPGRVAGSDLISSLSAAAAARGRSVFLLGGDPGTAEEAAEVLRTRNPELRVAGHHCPSIGFENDEAELRQVRDRLLKAQPDIVFVALGSPKQELFIRKVAEDLPSTWWLGIGISFSLLTGRVKRAPRWMQRCGVEWLHRLMQEPRRLAKRYLWQGVPFATKLLTICSWRGITSLFRGSSTTGTSASSSTGNSNLNSGPRPDPSNPRL